MKAPDINVVRSLLALVAMTWSIAACAMGHGFALLGVLALYSMAHPSESPLTCLCFVTVLCVVGGAIASLTRSLIVLMLATITVPLVFMWVVWVLCLRGVEQGYRSLYLITSIPFIASSGAALLYCVVHVASRFRRVE